MKTILFASVAAAALGVAGTANAADLRMPTKAPLMAPSSFSWTGCFVGTAAGLAAGHKQFKDSPISDDFVDTSALGRAANLSMSGGIWGGHIGCDYQFASTFVVGIQGAGYWTNLAGNASSPYEPSAQYQASTDSIFSITGRVGYAPAQMPNVMLYVRGGGAWAKDNFVISQVFADDVSANNLSMTRFGWTFGSGLEWAFTPSTSVFVETNYYNFGTFDSGTLNYFDEETYHLSIKQNIETIMVGVNLRFGGWR